MILVRCPECHVDLVVGSVEFLLRGDVPDCVLLAVLKALGDVVVATRLP